MNELSDYPLFDGFPAQSGYVNKSFKEGKKINSARIAVNKQQRK